MPHPPHHCVAGEARGGRGRWSERGGGCVGRAGVHIGQLRFTQTGFFFWGILGDNVAACVALGALLRCSRTLRELILREVDMDAVGLGYVVSGLQANPNSALQILDLTLNDRLGEEAACVALGGILRCNCILRELILKRVGMDGAGLGYVVSGLEVNSNSALQLLNLLGNSKLVEGGGAAQIAALLDHTLCPSLRQVNIGNTGPLDVAGAHMIGQALARNTLLRVLKNDSCNHYEKGLGMLLQTAFGETGSSGIDADVTGVTDVSSR